MIAEPAVVLSIITSLKLQPIASVIPGIAKSSIICSTQSGSQKCLWIVSLPCFLLKETGKLKIVFPFKDYDWSLRRENRSSLANSRRHCKAVHQRAPRPDQFFPSCGRRSPPAARSSLGSGRRFPGRDKDEVLVGHPCRILP